MTKAFYLMHNVNKEVYHDIKKWRETHFEHANSLNHVLLKARKCCWVSHLQRNDIEELTQSCDCNSNPLGLDMCLIVTGRSCVIKT